MTIDRLSALIDRFRIRAFVAHGAEDTIRPNLFLVSRKTSKCGEALVELVFRPREAMQDIDPGEIVVAARVELGGQGAPLALALPDEVRVDLCNAPALAAVASVLREEVESPRCGRQAAVDRLCEVVVIRLLRHAIEKGSQAGFSKGGLIAGLAHPQLALALVAMHEAPERNWRLEDLADVAGMSRTVFATSFREIVGQTPGSYLSNWRLIVARQEIAGGLPLKTVAGRVGFSSAAAFTRAYQRVYGRAPREDRKLAGLMAAE